MAVTNKLTIYLIKARIPEASIIKKTKNFVSIPDVGIFFYEDSSTREPSWFEKFFDKSLGDIKVFMASAKGVLLTSVVYKRKRIFFVISWGAGRHLINEQAIEEDFGLKVTLNSVEKESIRSIEKSNFGANSKISREQMSKKTNATQFGIDIEQDLLRAITGTSRFPQLGRTISGADALSVSVRVDIHNIVNFLSFCYPRYLSKDYQDGFDWIDQIHHIKNPTIISDLESVVVTKYNDKAFEKLWMAVPDLMDWNELEGFKYYPRQKDLLDDLYIEVLRDNIGEIDSLDHFEHKTVQAVSASSETVIDHWPVFKCLYAEVEHGGKQYVLNSGKWYEIDGDFVKKVNNFYAKIKLSDIVAPDYDHDNEGEYNIALAESQPEYLLMDKKTIMHGGGKNKIEFCDVYSKKRRMINIKHAGASAVLSHLFLQGSNAGEYFASDVDFRKKLNRKLEPGWKIRNPESKIDLGDYEVVFAIITTNSASRPDIPFFSKVSIKNVVRRLNGFGYRVSLKTIRSLRH